MLWWRDSLKSFDVTDELLSDWGKDVSSKGLRAVRFCPLVLDKSHGLGARVHGVRNSGLRMSRGFRMIGLDTFHVSCPTSRSASWSCNPSPGLNPNPRLDSNPRLNLDLNKRRVPMPWSQPYHNSTGLLQHMQIQHIRAKK